jgi:hypothetical protein
MVEKIIIIVEETTHEIDAKPINLVFNKSHCAIDYPDRFIIDAYKTLQHFDALEEIDDFTASFFKLVINDFPKKVNKENLKNSGMGYKHLIGLFSLSLKCFLENKKFTWRYPESYIHPCYQGNMADALVVFSDTGLFVKFVNAIKDGKFKDYLENGKDLRDYFTKVICCGYLSNFKK